MVIVGSLHHPLFHIEDSKIRFSTSLLCFIVLEKLEKVSMLMALYIHIVSNAIAHSFYARVLLQRKMLLNASVLSKVNTISVL